MITIVKDWSPKPYGRGPSDGPTCGQFFREQMLEKAMLENDSVHVVLTGYNRYGRSFLDEAFGGLIRVSGFTPEEVKRKLTYSHATLPAIIEIINDRIDAAIRDASAK